MQACKPKATGQVEFSTHYGRGKKRTERKEPRWLLRFRLPNGEQSEWTVKFPDGSKAKAWAKRGQPPAGCMTKAEAYVVAQAYLDSRAPETVTDDRRTFGRACAEHVEFCEREKNLDGSTIHEYQRIGRKLGKRPWQGEQTWGDRPIDSFTEQDLVGLRSEMLDQGKSPHTINQTRCVIRGAFGVDHPLARSWKWVPLKKRQSKGRIRVYSTAQVASLIDHAADDRDRAIFTLAAEQGLRINEIRALKIIQLNFEHRLLRIEDGFTDTGGHAGTKSNKIRGLPMTRHTLERLSAYVAGRPKYDDEGNPMLVFEEVAGSEIPVKYFALRKRMLKAIEAAGLPHLTLHELRHTFATTNIQSPKVDIHKLQIWLGHEDISTTQIYLHHQTKPEDSDILSDPWEESSADNVIPIRKAS